MRADWLGDILRDEGLTVIEHASPRGLGREMSSIRGVVHHDTVTTRAWSNFDVAELLRHGRPGVPGPLSQLGVDRQERVWWIADGRCNHNGYGQWGNNSIGIEVFAAGGLGPDKYGRPRSEVQSPGQRETVARAAAAILRHVGLPETCLQGHKEQDEARKIDPWNVDMAAMRAATALLIAGGNLTPEEYQTMEHGSTRNAKEDVEEFQHALNLFITLTGGGLPMLKVDGVYGDAVANMWWHANRRLEIRLRGGKPLYSAVPLRASPLAVARMAAESVRILGAAA